MLRPSSSISSSRGISGFRAGRSRRLRHVLATCGWTLLALAVLDFALGRIFALPADPSIRPGAAAQYFNYGGSIDGKIQRMLGPDDARSAPILVAGWIDRECRHVPAPALSPDRGVTIYGMSFTNHVADQLKQLDPRFTVATYSGPGAPPNHSFACFDAVQHSGHDPNPIQVLGVLASSLPRMLTLSGATTTFEAPQPFTYPRYETDAQGRLSAIEPIIRSPDDIRDPAKRTAFEAQLARHDAFYDPLQFDGQWADHSVFLRLLRRAYAQAEFRRRSLRLVNDGTQFRPDMGPPLRAILVAFARSVRAQGQRPIILLLQDRGSGTDSLARLVGSAPEQAGATVIRSDEIANVNDPRNFIADGHFTPAIDRLIAQKLLLAIENP